MLKALFGAVLSVGLAVGALSSASAALVPTSPACTNTGPWPSFTPAPVSCIGSFAGSDSAQQADVIPFMSASFVGLTGLGTWTLEETVPSLGSGAIMTSVDDSAGGSIDFAAPITGFFSLGLNSNSQFSLFLFNGTPSPIASVDYSTASVFMGPNGRRIDLSEASFYSFDAEGGGGTGIIPLPATGVLLGGGLLVAGLIARRRAKR